MKTEWIVRQRGEDIPEGAICAGSNSKDGIVYVARFNDTPGKVITEVGPIVLVGTFIVEIPKRRIKVGSDATDVIRLNPQVK